MKHWSTWCFHNHQTKKRTFFFFKELYFQISAAVQWWIPPIPQFKFNSQIHPILPACILSPTSSIPDNHAWQQLGSPKVTSAQRDALGTRSPISNSIHHQCHITKQMAQRNTIFIEKYLGFS